jgi:DNA-binding transcriptional MerR regulator
MSTGRLRIGELADLAGVTTRTLRHYERVGALRPPRRATNGYRTYPVSALLDVLEIRQLQRAGLSLQDAAATRVDRARGRESTMLERLRDAEADLDAQIEGLTARRTVLRDLRSGLAEGDALLAQGGARPFTPIERRLRALGVSERAIADQRRAWSALSGVRLPADWQAVVEAGLAHLERSPIEMEGLADVLDLVASLRGTDPTDPAVAAVGDRLAALARDLPAGRAALSLAVPDAVPILAVVASCFTAAQIAAVLHAVQVRAGAQEAPRSA